MPTGLALAISILIVLMFLAYITSLLLYFFSPFYSTPMKDLKEILKILKVRESQKFADLGSGDGRVVFEVYKKYKCLSVGYEVSPVLLMIVKMRKLLLAPFNSKIQFKEESFFNASLSEYDVIYCCLPNDVLDSLEKKLKKELKKNTQVYTYKSKISWKNGKEFSIGDIKVYQYTF